MGIEELCSEIQSKYTTDALLLYDGECTICNHFQKYLDIKENYELTIVNAREDSALVSTLRDQKYDINNGMILFADSTLYQGKKAALKLDSMSYRRGMYRKMMSTVIRIPGAVHVVYPTLKFIRKLILWAKRKPTKI